MKTNTNYKQRLSKIKAFVFDVDGVFTNGEIFFINKEQYIRAFNAKDSYALSVALEKGFEVAIITRGNSANVQEVLEKIGVKNVYLGVMNKGEVLKKYISEKKLSTSEILFMGDDIPDFECVKIAGIGSCPRDAVKELREIADYISTFKGGKGAVRDVIEQTLKVQDKWV